MMFGTHQQESKISVKRVIQNKRNTNIDIHDIDLCWIPIVHHTTSGHEVMITRFTPVDDYQMWDEI